MAKNAFSKFKGFVSKPNRNVFDLSFQNNMTGGFGALYPVFCKEVVPGDSFRIKPTMGFRAMPMYFPVQTNIRADLHFFYVRNRNLWSDWTDFICGNKSDLVAPYLNETLSSTEYADAFGTGSLADYLGVPSTLAGAYGADLDLNVFGTVQFTDSSDSEATAFCFADSSGTAVMTSSYAGNSNEALNELLVGETLSNWIDQKTFASATGYGCAVALGRYAYGSSYTNDSATLTSALEEQSVSIICNQAPSGTTSTSTANLKFLLAYDPVPSGGTILSCILITGDTVTELSSGYVLHEFTLDSDYLDTFNAAATAGSDGYRLMLVVQGNKTYNPQYTIISNVSLSEASDTSYNVCVPLSATVSGALTDTVTDVGDSYRTRVFTSSLTDSSVAPTIKISALPFRAYESIYNAFYRNQQNDPFTIDDVPEYNKWLENTDGGADAFSYRLHYRNWENDFLTTAVQSPQQGNAPLVGVSASGTFTFQDSDGNEYTAKAVVGDDGLLTGIQSYDSGLPSGSLRNLIDAISYGININDFRNVNALQRWLETNIRRGYRYKEQLLSHFGVDASFEELDMPEFIGGMSQPINVSTTYQTSEGSNDPLGSYAGNATCFGQSEHYIDKYCDEHGFIIGILSFVPTPVYSQLLPKMFLKNSPLDYFFPEFGHIGMQPITYGEVCPIQRFSALVDDETIADGWQYDTFGYQRAWYDYLGSTDEVHGEFRTSLRDFLCNRTFESAPELGPDFLHIDPDQLNDIFSVTDTSDKFLGLLNFEVTAKRPIPMFGIPRLE